MIEKYESLISEYGFKLSDQVDHDITDVAELFVFANQSNTNYIQLEIFPNSKYSVLHNNYYVEVYKDDNFKLLENY